MAEPCRHIRGKPRTAHRARLGDHAQAHRDQLAAAFDEIGRRLRACRPDLLVVISPDHWVNFFISNLPAVCIGIGDEHDGPPEPFMKKVFPHERPQRTPGVRPAPAGDRARQRFRARVVPSPAARSRRLHSAVARRGRPHLPLVPILVNDLEGADAEHQALSRLGPAGAAGSRELSRVVARCRARHRGLEPFHRRSHNGMDRREFDHACIKQFQNGEEQRSTPSSPTRCHRPAMARTKCATGSLPHARPAATGFELIDYFPSPETLVGGVSPSWKPPADQRRIIEPRGAGNDFVDVTASPASSVDDNIRYFGVHHLALNTDDMKMTVDFYVGVLGMRLVHAMRVPPGIGTGPGNRGNPPFEEIRHYFFDMGRDALLAFFEMPKGAKPKGDRNALGNMQHVSFAVSPQSQARIRRRLDANKIPYEGRWKSCPGFSRSTSWTQTTSGLSSAASRRMAKASLRSCLWSRRPRRRRSASFARCRPIRHGWTAW